MQEYSRHLTVCNSNVVQQWFYVHAQPDRNKVTCNQYYTWVNVSYGYLQRHIFRIILLWLYCIHHSFNHWPSRSQHAVPNLENLIIVRRSACLIESCRSLGSWYVHEIFDSYNKCLHWWQVSRQSQAGEFGLARKWGRAFKELRKPSPHSPLAEQYIQSFHRKFVYLFAHHWHLKGIHQLIGYLLW